MPNYKKHLFFCVNQRCEGKTCCADANANLFRDYAKKKLKKLDEKKEYRVNQAGCLGRCKEGPILVIYPEGVWYTYQNEKDIDEIIEMHVLQDKPVERLLLDPAD